ncbi:MAG: hypothetical protein V1736_12290 [Pseudomonadota bacterium]
MGGLTQKKFSINRDQQEFLENCKKWGYSDQSSLVREALDRLIKDLKAKKRKTLMAQKAQELASDYKQDEELTVFTSLDGEDFV